MPNEINLATIIITATIIIIFFLYFFSDEMQILLSSYDKQLAGSTIRKINSPLLSTHL